jgi:hypothetical protein
MDTEPGTLFPEITHTNERAEQQDSQTTHAEKRTGTGGLESTTQGTGNREKVRREPAAGGAVDTQAKGPDSVADSTDRTDQEPLSTQSTKTAERLAELEKESASLRAALAEARIEQELVWAAEQQDAVNAVQVALLMKDRVKAGDDLKPLVVDANGDPALDEHAQPVTVADAVRAFLDGNPHLVRPTGGPSTGSGRGRRLDSGPTALTGRTPALTGGELIAEALREGE